MLQGFVPIQATSCTIKIIIGPVGQGSLDTLSAVRFPDPKCGFMMLPPRNMTVEQVRQILAEVVEALEAPDVVLKLEKAKAEAGRNVARKLKIVYPIIRQTEINIIERHGYDNSTDGLVQFTERVRDTEGLDKEINRLHLLIRNHYLSNDSVSSFMDMLTNS